MLRRGAKQKVGMRLEVVVVSLENIPSSFAGRLLAVSWRRGSKKENAGETSSARYNPETGLAKFSSAESANGFVFPLKCTLFKDKKTNTYEEKNLALSVRVLPADPPISIETTSSPPSAAEKKHHRRSSSLSSSITGEVLGKALFNLATVISNETGGEVSKSISLIGSTGYSGDPPTLNIRVKTFFDKVEGKKLVKASESKKSKEKDSESSSRPGSMINIAGTDYCLETSDEMTESDADFSSTDASEFTDDDDATDELTMGGSDEFENDSSDSSASPSPSSSSSKSKKKEKKDKKKDKKERRKSSSRSSSSSSLLASSSSPSGATSSHSSSSHPRRRLSISGLGSLFSRSSDSLKTSESKSESDTLPSGGSSTSLSEHQSETEEDEGEVEISSRRHSMFGTGTVASSDPSEREQQLKIQLLDYKQRNKKLTLQIKKLKEAQRESAVLVIEKKEETPETPHTEERQISQEQPVQEEPQPEKERIPTEPIAAAAAAYVAEKKLNAKQDELDRALKRVNDLSEVVAQQSRELEIYRSTTSETSSDTPEDSAKALAEARLELEKSRRVVKELEDSLEKQRKQREELAEEKKKVEAWLEQEREHIKTLSEEKEAAERALEEEKQRVENTLREEKERSERDLTEEKQRAEKLLQEKNQLEEQTRNSSASEKKEKKDKKGKKKSTSAPAPVPTPTPPTPVSAAETSDKSAQQEQRLQELLKEKEALEIKLTEAETLLSKAKAQLQNAESETLAAQAAQAQAEVHLKEFQEQTRTHIAQLEEQVKVQVVQTQAATNDQAAQPRKEGKKKKSHRKSKDSPSTPASSSPLTTHEATTAPLPPPTPVSDPKDKLLIESLQGELTSLTKEKTSLEQLVSSLESKVSEMEQQIIQQTGELETTRQQLTTALNTINDLQTNSSNMNNNGSSSSPSLSSKKKSKKEKSSRKHKTTDEEGATEVTTQKEVATPAVATPVVPAQEVEALNEKLSQLTRDFEERLFFEETIYSSELMFEPLDPGQSLVFSTAAASIVQRLGEWGALEESSGHPDFVSSLINCLRNHVQRNVNRDDKALAYWIATGCSIQHLLVTEIGLRFAPDPLASGVQTPARPLPSPQIATRKQLLQEGMAHFTLEAYSALLQLVYQRIDRHLVLAFMANTSECILSSDPAVNNRRSDTNLENINHILDNALTVLLESHVFDKVVNTFFNQVFYYINSKLLNQLFQRSEYCTPTTGFRIKLGLSHLVDWIVNHSLKTPQRFLNSRNQFLHISQAATLLVAISSPETFFSAGTDITNSAFSALNAHQINQLLTSSSSSTAATASSSSASKKDEFAKPDANEIKVFLQRLLIAHPNWQSLPLSLNPSAIPVCSPSF